MANQVVQFVGASKETGPYAINGYYPLYATEVASNNASGGNGTSHSHIFFGQTFYMPNGLIKNVTYFHGNYDGSLTAEYNTGTTTSSATPILGYSYYKLNGNDVKYHTSWKMIDKKHEQRIFTSYNINQVDVDRDRDIFFIGCQPDIDTSKSVGYDIVVLKNAKPITNFSYVTDLNTVGYIKLGSRVKIKAGDFIEISAKSAKGLISETGLSKYEIPLSWGHNTSNKDIDVTSGPEYLEHFRTHISNQKNISGEALGSNNYDSIARQAGVENEIVQTNQDIVLGAFITDDHPGNLIDALRFNANEYEKYKNRLVHEIESYYENSDVDGKTNEYILEQILRNITSFKIGKDVFNKSYILPYGDNYTQEDFTIALGQTEITLSNYLDLDLIENSVLLYRDNKLLSVDKDYEFSAYNPIKIKFLTTLEPGDVIVTKLYNAERDSAQCPPTPSTVGIYPLFSPCIYEDKTFKTPVNVLLGHDGSKKKIYGDFRDDILLEFEKRIYNSAKAEFRSANSLPEYNVFSVRGGAFRDDAYDYSHFNDLLRHYFASWTNKNGLDPVINEFYDLSDKWSWNYSDDPATPGHWRGWYEFYYDTQRPNTHPWEMLGFTEQPAWWDAEYYVYEDSDTDKIFPKVNYGSTNTKMWDDLENGIIRKGSRENLTGDRWKANNPCQRIGLSKVLPVNANAELLPPADIVNTDTTTLNETWANSNVSPSSYKISSFRKLDGINVSQDGSNIYVESNNISSNSQIKEQELTFTVPDIDIITQVASPSRMGLSTIGVLVNGSPLVNAKDSKSFEGKKELHYNKVEASSDNWSINSKGVKQYHTISPDVIGLDEWATDAHSPIVGWAFDGLPIYGPYGYSDPEDSESEIVRIQTRWVVDSRTRGTVNGESAGPGGKPTGQFIEDYKNDTARSGNGYADQYNVYYSVTPDSPTTKIRHYVATIDSDGKPAFPYHVGGGSTNQDQRWQNQYFAPSADIGRITSIDITDKGGLYTSAPTITISGDGNGATATASIVDGKLDSITVTDGGSGYTYATATVTGGDGVRGKVQPNINEFDNGSNKGYVNSNATAEITSTKTITSSRDANKIDGPWKFGDGAPVENTWKYTSLYPFAVTEALVLAKPGRFATIFSDPTKLKRPTAQPLQLLSKNTNKRWNFLDSNDFSIHGDVNPSTGKMITNIGYTQFVYSWLKFQGLDPVIDYVIPLRSLNTKLAHRMSGFVDKDTLIARTDQYSNDGKASSLIIPKDNIHVALHSSNYKTRSMYSGVIIEQASSGYVVRGFDKNRGYFETLQPNKSGHRSEVTVGGEAVEFSTWEPSKTYPKDSVVERLGSFYLAPLKITSGTSFDKDLWQRLPALPQIGAVRATQYHESNDVVVRIPYETVFETTQEVYEFLISLGQYQEHIGYDFGEYDSAIADVRNWAYSAKQFLFWTSGTWSIGNTLELSPSANKVVFNAPRGFIAKINRSDREQFNLLDQDGAVIDPTECEILRESNRIEIKPPTGKQIYSTLLFTKEVEHAVVFDNKTQFNDVIFDDVLNQRHKRIKIKGSRTAGWNGSFSSEGFIINGDELKPNLDNMAESLGRYHEFGFVPVEKQLYEASRALFGYTERQYLSELDINDDEQFDFYRGLLQNKGTSTSLSRIARSSAVVQGNVSVYDEWALKVGDFGDTDKNQSVELKLLKENIAQDPQLVKLAFPEDTTNIIERIDVIDAKYSYYKAPTIEITSPKLGGIQATATATLDSNNKLSKITVTNAGTNYANGATAKVIASNVVISSNELKFNSVIARQSGFIDSANVSTVTITDNQSSNVASTITIPTNGANAQIVSANIVTAINENISTNANITAKAIASHTSSGIEYSTVISGADFTIAGGTALGIVDGTYQPTQKYAIENTMSGTVQTVDSDIIVKIDNEKVVSDSGNNWEYHAGSRNEITTTAQYPIVDVTASRATGNIEYPLTDTSVTFTLTTPVQTDNLEKDSLGRYKFIELFIGDVQIKNALDSVAFGDHDNDVNTAAQSYVTSDNTLFEIASDGTTITFPDVGLLPSSVKSTVLNPPSVIDANGEQQQLVEVLPTGTKISIAESPTVTFGSAFKLDKPGSTLNIKVIANDGIATRIGTRRNYEITEDLANDDMILIDIDDSERFLKKPSGERNNNLWNTTKLVNSTGLTDRSYPTILNSGYVNSSNVNFKAFGLTNLPDLHNDDMLFRPNEGSLIHVAKSEDNDWNVYKLQNIVYDDVIIAPDIDSRILARNPYVEKVDGKACLYTYESLFNFVDTNEIGEPNTGKYLDYYLTLKNKNLSDNVVIWTNEEVVQDTKSAITDFEAPQMIEARIESIGPAVLKSVFKTEPYYGTLINNLTLTPDANTSIVTVTGNSDGVEELDAVVLLDNIGEEYKVSSSLIYLSGNQVTVDGVGVYEVANIVAGSGYQTPPTVTFTTSPTGDTAKGLATITGGLQAINIDTAGSGYPSSTNVVIGAPDLPNGVQAEATATFGSDGEVTGISITTAGSGYSKAPDVILDGPFTQTSNLTASINGTVNKVYITNPGSGYSGTSVSVTMSAPPVPSGNTTATATVYRTNNTDLVAYGKTADEVKELLPTRRLYQEASNDASKVKIRLLGDVTDDIRIKFDPPRTDAEQEKFENINKVLNSNFRLASYNTSNDTFVIEHQAFGISGILNHMENIGYNVKVFNDYTPATGTYFTVTDVNFRSFKFDAGSTNIGFSRNVTAYHLNKTKVTVPFHGLQVGDIIRLDCNNFSGQYKVEQVLDNNTFVVPAKFIQGFNKGNLYAQGVKIKTIAPHEISPEYIRVNKRVAVSFADPKIYNNLYLVDSVTPNELIIASGWAPSETTVTYYEKKTKVLSGETPYDGTNRDTATNIITVLDDARLTERLVSYGGNAQVLASNMTSVEADLLIVRSDALPAQLSDNSWPPVNIIAQRERRRKNNQYPIVSTVDHNDITINGSTFKVDSYNNAKGVEHSINKAINFRKAVTDRSRAPQDGLRLTFTMLNDIETPVQDGVPAYRLSGYGPYVRDRELLQRLSRNELMVTEDFTVAERGENVIDENFNKGSRMQGPLKGLKYNDPITGLDMVWNPQNGTYKPEMNVSSDVYSNEMLLQKPLLPECHVKVKPLNKIYPTWVATDTTDFTAQDLAEVVYRKDTVIVLNPGDIPGLSATTRYQAQRDIIASDNTAFKTTASNSSVLWAVVNNSTTANKIEDMFVTAEEANNENLIARILIGNGLDDYHDPGVAQRRYAMLSEKQFTLSGGGTITIPRYKITLDSNNCYSYNVYQAVQNDNGNGSNGDIYYIKVDQVIPTSAVGNPFDIFATVSEYNDFSHTENGVRHDFKKVDYYYENNIRPTVDASNRITNPDDPMLLERTVSVVELEVAEPAAYIGNSLIPEPFAIQAGNNTNAEANYYALGRISIDGRKIEADTDGFDKYFIWTPGLTPNEWAPTEQGPGHLPGVNGNASYFGYGRGYYELNDSHLPDDYPIITEFLGEGQTPYNTPMPRFMYSKKFTVSPKAYNYPITIYFDSTGQQVTVEDDWVTTQEVPVIICPTEDSNDPDIQLPRPEEIFVACFWTEPHVYKNQLIGIDYSTLQETGQATPVYGNYSGTVVRVKYIRLTEMPPNAVTRRLIPDTGWAGREWLNKVIDKFVPSEENTILDYFQNVTPVDGGSTGEEDEDVNVILSVGNEPSTNDTAFIDPGGQLQIGMNSTDVVPATQQGPILNGELLKGLPGPCETVPTKRPPETAEGTGLSCSVTERIPQAYPITNLSAQRRGINTADNKTYTTHALNGSSDDNYPFTFDKANWHFETVKIAGNEDMTVFFNFPDIYGGVAIVQSDTPYYNKIKINLDAGNQSISNDISFEPFNIYSETDNGTIAVEPGKLRAFRFVTNSVTQVDGTPITGSFTFDETDLETRPKVFVTQDLRTITDYDTTQGVSGFQTFDNYDVSTVTKQWYQSSTGTGTRFEPSEVYYLCFDNRGGEGVAGVLVTHDVTPDPEQIPAPTTVRANQGFDDSSWWKKAKVLKTTNVSGAIVQEDGSQIGRYGVDLIGGTGGTKRLDYVDNHILSGGTPDSYSFDKSKNRLGVEYTITAGSTYGDVDGDEDHRVLANHLQSYGQWPAKDSGTPTAGDSDNMVKWYGVDIGVKGPGFITQKINCTQGEYVTIFFRTEEEVTRSDLETSVKWLALIDYVGEKVSLDNEILDGGLPSDTVDPTCLIQGGASGWATGATVDYWGRGDHKSAGYFGSTDKRGEREKTGSVDNIYWPHNSYPSTDDRGWWERTDSGVTIEDTGSDNRGSMTTREKGTSNNVTYHRDYKGKWRGNLGDGKTGKKIYSTTWSTFSKPADGSYNRNWLANYSCMEIKGYFQAPYTGVYEVMAQSDDGIWVWISSDGTDGKSFKGKPLRKGVDDLVGRNRATGELLVDGEEGYGEKEFFKEDGYRAKDKYNYSRYNSLVRTGWLTTDTDNNHRLVLPNRYVFLEKDKFYFIRMITGNNKGPGFTDVRYNVYDSNGGFDVENVPNTGNTLASNQYFKFSGRSCAQQTPGGGDTGTGTGTGGGGYGGGGEGYYQYNMSDGQRDGYGRGQYYDMWGQWIYPDGPWFPPIGEIPTDVISLGGEIVGNSSAPGQRELTGMNITPSGFKQQMLEYDPNNFTFGEQLLTRDNPVAGNVQRVSGGIKIPMSRVLQNVPRGGQTLNNSSLTEQPWGQNVANNGNLNKTSKKIAYKPKGISSYVNLNGTAIYNVIDDAPKLGDDATVVIDGPAFAQPGINTTTSPGGPGTGVSSEVFRPPLNAPTKLARPEYSLMETDLIFNRFPSIDIQPMELDDGGFYSPAGPKASFVPRKPTPEVSFDTNDLVGIAEGSELIVNGRRIVIRGNDARQIKTQVNCAEMGVSALLDENNNTFTMVSCSGSPISIVNGCGGGTYKQVGDFHINRGFDQSKTETQQFVPPLYGATTKQGTIEDLDISLSDSGATASGGGGEMDNSSQGQVGLIQAGQIIHDYTRRPDGTLEQSYYNISNQDEIYKLPARIPIVTSTKTTSGSNYRVGDRLRLVGGTPVVDATGPIAEICINSAGSGYTNPNNVRIIFNEVGTAPGVGAAAQVTELDENGGIAKIVMLNNGAAYDVANPPEITVQDTSPTPTVKVINAAWPEQITLEPNDILQVNSVEQRTGGAGIGGITEEVRDSRYVRATAGVVLGGELTVPLTYDNAGSPEYAYTTDLGQPCVQFTYDGVASPFTFEPETYVRVSYLPGTSMNDFNADVVSLANADANITLTSTTNISVGDILVKNDGGNLKLMAKVTGVDTNNDVVTVDATEAQMITMDLEADETVYWGKPQSQLFFIPKQQDPVLNSVTPTDFILQSSQFASESVVANMFGATQFDPSMPGFVTFTLRRPWWKDLLPSVSGERPRLVNTCDPRIPKVAAKLTAEIGDVEAGIGPEGETTYSKSTMHKNVGPIRCAKFIVTDVNYEGGITGLKVIDRGLYKEFPSDLTFGIPLEYDYAPQGSFKIDRNVFGDVVSGQELTPDQIAELTDYYENMITHTLGMGDPSRPGTVYGPSHPEYGGWPFSGAVDFLADYVGDGTQSTGITPAGGSSPLTRKEAVIKYEALVDKINSGEDLNQDEQGLYDRLLSALSTVLGFKTFGKHPDWTHYPEYVFNGAEFITYGGSPGAYDPSTWTAVDLTTVASLAKQYQTNPMEFARVLFDKGLLKRKTKRIDTDPLSATYGQYLPNEVAGGTGARVFLTAQEVPNCLEKGTAVEALGLPDLVTGVNAPQSLARQINDALNGAGYLDDEIKAIYKPIGDLGQIEIDSGYPGVEIGTDTPGTLEKLGIPAGIYNTGMLCIDATVEDNQAVTPEQKEIVRQQLMEELYEKDEFGLLNLSDDMVIPGQIPTQTHILSLVCADVIGNPPGLRDRGVVQPLGLGPTTWPLNDNNSLFGNGKQAITRELFKYDLVNVFGNDVSLAGPDKQTTPVLYFESKRFNDKNVIQQPDTGDFRNVSISRPSDALPELFDEPNAWVDSYSNASRKRTAQSTDLFGDGKTNIVFDMPGFVEGGWVYFENGKPKRWQTELVDVNYINNAIVYDPETGNKILGLDVWDPFKGILPGFIQNEIHFTSEQDPASYNNARTMFGKQQVGKVWWDTSTVRYEWYEQGNNSERAENWGKAFPGSQITICEWVESKALPANWTGNGVPRWTDRYVTERKEDPITGEYQMHYYYWVINRSIVDDRIKSSLGRKLDTTTIARYISNPRGYGLSMISYISKDGFLLWNTSNIDVEESHLQINLSRNANPEGISHAAWKLIREGDDNSEVPAEISDKLVDSLCGENAIAQPVPDPRLSDVEKYGIQFRPRQTMFANVKEARRILVNKLNKILAGTRLNTRFAGWDLTLPSARAYIETINWYAVDYVDPITKEEVRYNDNVKPVFNVAGVAELYKLQDLADGTVIQVRSNQNSVTQLWKYRGTIDDFELIMEANDTIRITDKLFTDETNPTLSSELRLLLTALKDNVFTSTSTWNEVFFELLKYAYLEQQQLDWAFKTSYLYIEKEEDDLIEFNGFKPDNFQRVLDYMNEAKPYTSKIREYKDGKRTPVDLIGQNNISDYDKPPYVDFVSGNVRILDDNVSADRQLMANNKSYVDYWTATVDGLSTADPIRHSNTTIVFDRTNWQLTESNWDTANVDVNQSIGYNIANLTQLSNASVAANTSFRAADKIFKFDPAVQSAFTLEVNNKFNSQTASRQANIVGNGTIMASMVANNELKNTLALVKDKVGGNFRGDTLDGNEFSMIEDNAEYFSEVQTLFGFDTDPWDENTNNDTTVVTDERNPDNYGFVTTVGIGDAKFDDSKQIVSYEGVFNQSVQGSVTLVKNDEIYEGFDGVTFQRVLYGEERPEELAVIDPKESLIMTVTTSEFSRGAAGNVSVYDGDDLANATLFHSTIALDNVTILNPGIGYVSPTVTIVEAESRFGNPLSNATATASLHANGAVSSITVTSAGSGYKRPKITLTESLTEVLASSVELFTNELTLVSNANVLVGQQVSYSNIILGSVETVNGNVITINQLITRTISNGQQITFSGQDFDATFDVEDESTPEASVYIDKAFVDLHPELTTIYGAANIQTVANNISVYNFANVITFPNLTSTSGANPDANADFFAVDTVSGWDTGTETGGEGSFDVALTEVQERVAERVAPMSAEVKYRIHQSLFGASDYLRISSQATTEVVGNITASATSITLKDASFLPVPTSIVPGSIWIGSERIQYGRRSGNKISALTRGAFGTTPQSHANRSKVYSAEDKEHFNHLNPQSNVWLDIGTRYSGSQQFDSTDFDQISQSNVTYANVGVTLSDVSNTSANLTLIGTGTANVSIDDAVRIFANANVDLFEAVKVTANTSGVLTITASNQDTLDSTLFVEGGTATLRTAVYGEQGPDDDFDSANVSGQTALSLADRANADFGNTNSIMRFLHRL